MENEELAALRATLRAAERLPAAARARQARLSERVADGDELLPYVLAPSCSDRRDRLVRDDVRLLRILEGGRVSCPPPSAPAPPRYEPAPVRPGVVVLVLLALATILFLLHGLFQALLLG